MAQNDRYNRRNWEDNESNVGSSYDRNENYYNRDRDYEDDRNRSYNRGNQSNFGNRDEDRYRSNSRSSYGNDYDRDNDWGNSRSGSYSYGNRNYGGDRNWQDRDRGGSSGYGGGSGFGNDRDDYNRGGSYGGSFYGSGAGYGAGSYGGYGDRARRYNYDRSDWGSSYGNRNYGRGNDRGYNEQDRGWWDRTKDEVSSWFGDDDAERRRRMDHMEDHRGRGPKNYERSEDRIKEDVNDRLSDDAYLDASDIEVEVNGTDVILKGTVKDRRSKRRAEDLAEYVSGVQHVENRIRVNQDWGSSSSNNYASSSYGNTTGESSSTNAYSTGTTSSNKNK